MASPVVPTGGHWIAHLSPDGRPFWNHSLTKQSVWEKPTELKTPIEKEMENTPWKDAPPLGSFSQIPTGPSSSLPLTPMSGALVAPGGQYPTGPSSGLPSRPGIGGGNNQQMPSNNTNNLSTTLPEFQSHADAERAFMNMLSTLGVTPLWTWEQTMRESITEPYYKALKTLAERKTAFEKFVAEEKQKEREEREKSLERCRKEFFKGLDRLGGGPEREDGVKVWWGWSTAERELSRRMGEAWKGPRNENEKRTLFEEYVNALKTKESTKRKELRIKNIEKVTAILQSLSLDIAGTVRWREAQSTLYATPEWTNDYELQKLEPIDLLGVFEDELRKAEKEMMEAKQKAGEEKRRRGRKAREDFLVRSSSSPGSLLSFPLDRNHKLILLNLSDEQELLDSLVSSGTLHSTSTWSSIYALLETDERYHNLLGQPGSSPLDLFWDVVDQLDQVAEENERRVIQILGSGDKFLMTEKTSEEEFVGEVRKRGVGEEDVGVEALKGVFEKVSRREFSFGLGQARKQGSLIWLEQMHAREVRAAKEERRKAEKKLRLLIDDLRYAYKKLDPPVDLESTYDDNLAVIEEQPEFLALIDDEPSRRLAFEKFIKRQKEKAKERELAEQERKERDSNRRDRERGSEPSSSRSHRDSEYRSSTSSRRRESRAEVEAGAGDFGVGMEEDEKRKRGVSEDVMGGPPRKKERVEREGKKDRER
ncbi:pre-mRNA-processing factor 40, partial [Phenoliferia sp. Uapishka_3]